MRGPRCHWNPRAPRCTRWARRPIRTSPAPFTWLPRSCSPAYGITAGQIAPGTDVLTMRPGLASLPHMELTWGNYGLQQGPGGLVQKDSVLPGCTLSSDCLANPVMQTVSGLPSGTSAPNTVLTEYAVRNYHLHDSAGRVADPGTRPAHRRAAQRRAAIRPPLRGDGRDRVGLTRPRRDRRRRHRARHRDRARRAGHVGRPDPQRDRAGPAHAHRGRRQRPTRRMITAATAAALGLLGAILGMAGAVIAGLAWAAAACPSCSATCR